MNFLSHHSHLKLSAGSNSPLAVWTLEQILKTVEPINTKGGQTSRAISFCCAFLLKLSGGEHEKRSRIRKGQRLRLLCACA